MPDLVMNKAGMVLGLGEQTTLVGQAGLEQKIPTVMNASKTYRVLWEGNRGTQVSVREESGKAPRGSDAQVETESARPREEHYE